MAVSPQRRTDILDALRRGTVPERGLDILAVGLSRFEAAFDEELAKVKRGGASFKAVRGEYGSGKTFFGRWLQERAKRSGFAASEVQVSETETPLHQMGTVYRRLVERLSTADTPANAFRSIIDGWFYVLEQDSLGDFSEEDYDALFERTTALMEKRLAPLSRKAPAFAAALRAYRRAVSDGDQGLAEGILAWVAGQPNVAAEVKRHALVKGEVDSDTAAGFLRGLLMVLRDSGSAGLVFVLDEVETLQRVRSDVRDRGLNALRQLVDDVDGGTFPGLYVVVTGTSSFFEGPMGAQRLPPLAQRLHVDLGGDARFDNPRAVQVRLQGFSRELLHEVGRRVRDLYAEGSPAAERIRTMADDALLARLADSLTGSLGGRVGIVPRLFLKKLVSDVLDRIELFPDFDPRQHYAPTVAESELTLEERGARAAKSPDEIDLPV